MFTSPSEMNNTWLCLQTPEAVDSIISGYSWENDLFELLTLRRIVLRLYHFHASTSTEPVTDFKTFLPGSSKMNMLKN